MKQWRRSLKRYGRSWEVSATASHHRLQSGSALTKSRSGDGMISKRQIRWRRCLPSSMVRAARRCKYSTITKDFGPSPCLEFPYYAKCLPLSISDGGDSAYPAIITSSSSSIRLAWNCSSFSSRDSCSSRGLCVSRSSISLLKPLRPAKHSCLFSRYASQL